MNCQSVMTAYVHKNDAAALYGLGIDCRDHVCRPSVDEPTHSTVSYDTSADGGSINQLQQEHRSGYTVVFHNAMVGNASLITQIHARTPCDVDLAARGR